MKKYFFKVSQTYNEVTPESAEHGDFSDTGYEMETQSDYTIADILRLLREQGHDHMQLDSSTDITIYGDFYTACYREGIERQLCLHIAGKPNHIRRLFNIIEKAA